MNAAPQILELAGIAVEDERRHRGACARMAERYGHPKMEFAELTLAEVAPPMLPLPERVLYETVAFCAITESINAALLAETQKTASDTETHRVVHDILVDEVNHSRIGWGHLASVTISKAFLPDFLPFMLNATLPETLFANDPDDLASEAALRHGLLPRSALQRIFKETMNGVVIPGLEHFGVDAARAKEWMAKHAG